MISFEMVDGFLTDQQCDWFIELFKKQESVLGTSGSGPIQLVELTTRISYYHEVKFLAAALTRQSPIPNSFVDYMQVVQRGPGCALGAHFDFEDTVYSGVTYLNEDFEGGRTFLEDEEDRHVVEPKKGRSIFFRGSAIKHGLNMISEGERYTIASWFRDTKPVPAEIIKIARQRETERARINHPHGYTSQRGKPLFKNHERLP